MRNDYYDLKWTRVTLPVQGKQAEQSAVEPYGQVPSQTGQPQAQPAPVGAAKGDPRPNRTPDVWQRSPRPIKKKREKTGIPGFLCCFALLLGLTGLAVYFQGGLPVIDWWKSVMDAWNGSYQYQWPGGNDSQPWNGDTPWSGDQEDGQDRNWLEDLPNTAVKRAPVGGGATLTMNSEAGEVLTPQEIYEKVNPSIVGVQSLLTEGRMSMGTGIVMSPDGYIVTNAHVIAGSWRLEVLLNDGTWVSALLVGYDSSTDLAVLKVEGKDLPVADFGDSEALRVGDPAWAIGNPLGMELRGTMTDGMISAINREVGADNGTMTLIQTTAALNPGNSGGALVNAAGQVVGITNMKMMAYEDEVYEGLGFAIPTAVAKEVVDQLIDQGYYDDGVPLLGVTVSTILPDGDQPAGAYVMSVVPASDAYKKGIRAGDIIISANGETITDVDGLLAAKADLGVGDTLTLEIWRERGKVTVDIVLMTRHQMDKAN